MTADIHDDYTIIPEGHSSRGRLERILRRGEFAVTAELNPPDSADPNEVYERGAVFDGWVDGINATDGSGANCHMSSVGICALLTRVGYAPIMQISCRDRNRIAIQGDVLGAAAMGVANILCLTGDGVQAGDQPGAKPVFDFDCMSLLETIRTMRDEGKFLSGRPLTEPPRVFLGAAINPFAPPYDFRPLRLKKKIEAGAQFVQSQYCYDLPRLKEYMKRVCDMGLHEKCFIMIGVGPLASAKTARWIRSNVPGVHIPDDIVKRLAAEIEGVNRLVFAMGGVEGVLASPPQDGEPMPELLSTLSSNDVFVGEHQSDMDVTGGIGLKVKRGFEALDSGIEVWLVSGEHGLRVQEACMGLPVTGTQLLKS